MKANEKYESRLELLVMIFTIARYQNQSKIIVENEWQLSDKLPDDMKLTE